MGRVRKPLRLWNSIIKNKKEEKNTFNCIKNSIYTTDTITSEKTDATGLDGLDLPPALVYLLHA